MIIAARELLWLIALSWSSLPLVHCSPTSLSRSASKLLGIRSTHPAEKNGLNLMPAKLQNSDRENLFEWLRNGDTILANDDGRDVVRKLQEGTNEKIFVKSFEEKSDKKQRESGGKAPKKTNSTETDPEETKETEMKETELKEPESSGPGNYSREGSVKETLPGLQGSGDYQKENQSEVMLNNTEHHKPQKPHGPHGDKNQHQETTIYKERQGESSTEAENVEDAIVETWPNLHHPHFTIYMLMVTLPCVVGWCAVTFVCLWICRPNSPLYREILKRLIEHSQMKQKSVLFSATVLAADKYAPSAGEGPSNPP